MKRSRAFSALVGVLAVLGTAAPVAQAASPHFVNASASIDNAGNLTVSWKEAGLGDNQLINYTAGASASGFYACINGGGKHPSATNKEAFEGPVSGSGTFASGKNGSISQSLTVSPPPSALDCPNGQRLVLACITYTNVSVADNTNGIVADVPTTLSKTFLPLPECA